MSTEDLINNLYDTLDMLAELARLSPNSRQQEALRINAGSIIAALRKQLDDLDYSHAMFVCELDPLTTDHYRRIYLEAARAHAEVSA